jgi:hypothetical protein
MDKKFKPNTLGILGIVVAVAGAALSIANAVISDKKSQAYLDNKFEDWTKTKN